MKRTPVVVAGLTMAVTALFICASAGAARAALSVGGPTGLVLMPNAVVVPTGTIQVAADYINTDDFVFPVRVGYGLMEGLEVGASYSFVDAEDTYAFGANAKYILPLKPAEALDLAAGAIYSMGKVADYDISSLGFYGVASYATMVESLNVRGSGGIRWERGELEDNSETGFRFFIGLDLGIREDIAVVAEFESKSADLETDSLTSIGIRYTLMESLTLQAGLSNLHRNDHEFFFGAQYALGFNR